jgi:hypothetical protein
LPRRLMGPVVTRMTVGIVRRVRLSTTNYHTGAVWSGMW